MEYVRNVLMTPVQRKCDPQLVPMVSLGTVNFIKINATTFTLDRDQATQFLKNLDYRSFIIWAYSLHEDHHESSVAGNWILIPAFLGALVVFYSFGWSQREASYSSLSSCLLNVFRLSLGQPLRKDPKRWSMRFVLIAWVLFQMHAGVIYQGVLMSYKKSYDHRTTDFLIIPNVCLVKLQRLFETGHFKINQRRNVINTLRASSQTQFLLTINGIGWLTSFAVFLIERWTARNWFKVHETILYLKVPLKRDKARHTRKHFKFIK